MARRKTDTTKQSCVSEHVKNVIERMDRNEKKRIRGFRVKQGTG